MPPALALFPARAARAWSVAWMLAAREWQGEIRQSRMAIVWPVAQPMAYTLLFTLLRPLMGGAAQSSPWSFSVYVFVGFTLWQTWFEVLRSQMDALRKHKGLMSRGELGTATLVLATALASAFQLVPRLLLAALAAIVVLQSDARAIGQLLACGLIVLANGSVIGALLQPFATLSPDLGRTIQSLSLALMVTGAVFMPIPDDPPRSFELLLAANPMGTLLDAARAPLFGESLFAPHAVVGWIALTLLLAALLPSIGRKVLPIIVERLGG